MSKYIYFTPEEKARAQSTDLVSLLRAQGERPVRSGREFRTPNDPSITVRGNKWFDHSKREGGYAVSFAQRYYRLPYQEAVLLLLGRKNGKSYEQAKPAKEAPKPFALPEPYGTMRRMYAYLMRQRHIDRDVITGFVREKLLYEDVHHNCVFVGLDGSGEAKHAHIRSTNSEGRVFRMNIESSASEHCFHKDGTDKSLLQEEHIDQMDAFIAVTGDEESNILSCLLAKSLGVKETVARVNKAAYLPLVEAIGIAHSVSPRLSAVNSILQYIRQGKVLSSVSVGGDAAEMLEALVDEESLVAGKRVHELGLPKGILLLGVIRGGEAFIPSGQTVIQPQDRIVLLSLREKMSKLEGIVSKKKE